MSERQIMPVGSTPPETKLETPAETPAETPVEKPSTEEQQKLYAGKYKSPEEIETAYSELEKKLGEQGNRLGQAEKEKEFLMSQIQQAQTVADTKPAAEAVDLNDQLQEIQDKVEEGDLTIDEGLRQTVQLSSQIASETAVKTVQQQQQQQAVLASKDNFITQHPDFLEMQQSGQLEQAKAQLPGLHDDFSAYWAMKADQNAQALETAVANAQAQGIEAGKTEMQKLATGDERTGKVLQKPGGQAKEIGRANGPYTETQMRESGLAALQKARGG